MGGRGGGKGWPLKALVAKPLKQYRYFFAAFLIIYLRLSIYRKNPIALKLLLKKNVNTVRNLIIIFPIVFTYKNNMERLDHPSHQKPQSQPPIQTKVKKFV